MKVLGIDPGFASCGYALIHVGTTGETVVELGVLRTEKSAAKRQVLATDDNVRRTRELARPLTELVQRADVVCAESMSFPRNASAAGKMCLCWGLLVGLVFARDLPLLEASPQEIKKRICGRRDASKEELERELVRRYEPLPPEVPASLREHAYDALGAAVACLDSDVIRLARRLPA